MSGEADDVIELLTRDHGVLRDLLARLDQEDDPAQLSVLFLRIVDELAGHEAAEQQIVYPAFRAALPTEERETLHRLGEHEEINELLAEMRFLTSGDAGFDKRASALCLELEAHFATEEGEVFPRLRASVSHEDLVELGQRAAAVKASAPAFPEPEHTEHVHAVRGQERYVR